MTLTIVIVFLLGYLLISLESNLKVNKTAIALLLSVVLWTLYSCSLAAYAPDGISLKEFQDTIINIHFVKHLGDTGEIIFFLLGAMTIVEVVDANGGFNFVRQKLATRSKHTMLWRVVVVTFLLSAILLIIIQQTLFYGMSLLAGTMREENRSFASLPDRFHGHGVGRIVLGRGAAYWFLYMGIGMYIAFIVPAIFGLPQRGNYWDILLLLLFFVTDCVFFSMTWSTLVTKRETVFVLFLFMSPICLFLTGTSWPTVAIPGFWKVFSYIFPSTFGVQAFINMNSAGGDLATAHDQMIALTIQTVLYFVLAMAAVSLENWVIRNRERIREEGTRRIEERFGVDLREAYEENKRIITGE